ncbi:MAG: hypothetical protein V4598_05660 [Bdellovibrionota bacterium]
MSLSSLDSFKIKAKLLQKFKKALHNKEFALKDAYQILAKNAGYDSWKAFKDDLEVCDILNPPHWSAQWKVWYPTYQQASEAIADTNKFLLPYRGQFFVAEESYILELGISLDDSDLLLIGRDWAKPKDKEAWERLLCKIKAHHNR